MDWLQRRWIQGHIRAVLWSSSAAIPSTRWLQVLFLVAVMCLENGVPFVFLAPPRSAVWRLKELDGVLSSGEFWVTSIALLHGTKASVWKRRVLSVHLVLLAGQVRHGMLPEGGASQDVCRQVPRGLVPRASGEGRRVERWPRLVLLLRSGDVEQHPGLPRRLRYRRRSGKIDLVLDDAEEKTKLLYEARLDGPRAFFASRLATVESLRKPVHSVTPRGALFCEYQFQILRYGGLLATQPVSIKRDGRWVIAREVAMPDVDEVLGPAPLCWKEPIERKGLVPRIVALSLFSCLMATGNISAVVLNIQALYCWVRTEELVCLQWAEIMFALDIIKDRYLQMWNLLAI